MATSSTTLVASSRVASSLFGVMATNYWSSLSEGERNSSFGEVSQLVWQDKTAWNIAGCLEQHWRLDLSAKVAEICNNPNNMKRIYRRHRHRPNIVTDMYLFGYVGRQSEAFPAIIVISASGSIAKRLAGLLRCHESLRLPGFEVLHLEVKVNLLVGKGKQHDRTGAIVSSSSITEGPGKDVHNDTARRKLMQYEPGYHGGVTSHEDLHEARRSDDGEWQFSSIFDESRHRSTYIIGGSMSDSSGLRLGNSKSTLNPRMPRLDEESFGGARSSINLNTQSLCGSRVVTSALLSDPLSSWRQFTVGGVISLGGKLYGMTVAHPFFEPAAFFGSEGSNSSLLSSDSGQDEDFESDSQDDGEEAMHATPSISHSSFDVYLEKFEVLKQKQSFPTAASFSRLGSTSVLSTIGTFIADQSFASKYWSSELDWALLEITKQQFMSPNLVSTAHGLITPSSVKKKQDLREGMVVVASGVSGIIYTRVHSTVAQIILPMSATSREVWKIDCVCAPGDCGAWVICPDTGAIYGIVIAASPSLQLTYILPAELVFGNLMAQWNMDLSQTQELFTFNLPSEILRPELVDIPARKGNDSRHAEPVNSPGSWRHKDYSQQALGRDTISSSDSARHFSLNPADFSRTRNPQWSPPQVLNTSTYQSGLDAPKTSSVAYNAPLQYPPRQSPTFGRASGDLDLSAESRPEPCHLTPLGQRFARIRVGQIKECVNFIVSEQAVLKEDPQHFLREAGALYRNSKTQDARACIQQALIIDHCSGLDKEDIQDYLSDLIGLRKSTVKKLSSNVDKTFTAVKTKSDESTPLEDTVPRRKTTADRSRHVPAEGKHSLGDDQTQRSPSPTASDLVNKFSSINLNTGRLPSISQPMLHEAAHDNRYRPATGSRGSWSTASTRGSAASGTSSNNSSLIIEDVQVRGTEGEFEPLDPRYRQRRDKAEYFIVGRVFAILWHENLGITNKKPGPDVQITRDNRFGEKIFSHMRRMVVVRQRYGYCWCVSINTYGGRGLVGKFRGDAEVQSHTIVYESTSRPAMFKEEQGLMSKEPIAVDMVSGHTLDKASRLNYAKVCTVEHNVKVMDIGMVSDRSRPYLVAHWRDETAK